MHGYTFSWRALCQPGQDNEYFQHPVFTQPISPLFNQFNAVTACWMVEFSRMSYCGTPPKKRDQYLQTIGWKETFFLSQRGVQCAIYQPLTKPQFRVLVFRGSSDPRNILTDLHTLQTDWPLGGKVHRGFESAFSQCQAALKHALTQSDLPLLVTGHSLGGALAILTTSRFGSAATYTFGAPRVGNQAFADTVSKSNLFHIVNHRDAIPCLPPTWGDFFVESGAIHYFSFDFNHTVNPTPTYLKADRRRSVRRLAGIGQKHLNQPPEELADHAPLNYFYKLLTLV